MYKRILVVSINCFSLENSNGRTLASFVKGWPVDRIAQFYMYNQIPNSDVCNNYFRVTDKQALCSLLTGSVTGKIDWSENAEKSSVLQNRLAKHKNPLVLLLRNMVWHLGFWKGKHFQNWVDEFNPELIFVQAGDAAYSLKIATDLAQKRTIPLLIFNSEGHYFKNYNCMTNAKLTKVFYPIFNQYLRKQLNKTIGYASHTIYSCEPLKKDFDSVFNKSSSVIYTASDIKSLPTNFEGEKPLKLSYLGNLGFNRHETLIELANVIQRIDSELVLDVYAKCPTDDILKALMDCNAINYKGFVSYQEVKIAIEQSDILFHVENFSDFYFEEIKYGFSTKIADSLMSGKCFFIYAPEFLACTKYMIDNIPECVASNRIDLSTKMKSIIKNRDFRVQCSRKCLEIAKKNHASDVVVSQFLRVVDSIMLNEKL